ncbi:MAG: Thymidylate kinase [Candidatus Adlerbacteria bacterium]|nr:Thymidylate kinase [Candidatus Adlerbacteria bacterium]
MTETGTRPYGKFIVIDGMDGCGKGTQIDLLKEALIGQGVRSRYTREPGGEGVEIAEEIRKMLLRKDGPPKTPTCDFFLFWASRAAHVEMMVRPWINQGRHVISDRYDSSTFAFQIYGEGQFQLESVFLEIRGRMGLDFRPDAYILLDLPAEVADERMKIRAKEEMQKETRFDAWPLEKHESVRQGFRHFEKVVMKDDRKGKVYMIDANRSREEVHADILAAVLETVNFQPLPGKHFRK